MARGRIVSNAITMDKRVNDLSSDTSRLGFTWLITFADCEGRTYGDPAVVRSMLFPRRGDISIEQIEAFLQEWQSAGLIIWYEAEGDKWVSFPRFERHQPNLRKDREAPSIIPPPPAVLNEVTAELIRQDDGVTPESIPVKLKEEKLKQHNGGVDVVLNAFSEYEQNIGALTQRLRDVIGGAVDDYSEGWVIEAIHIAAENNKRKWSYIDGILQNWKRDGKGAKSKPDNRQFAEVY